MADLLPPGPDVSGAPKLLGITGALYVVTLLLFSGRIHTRFRHQNLGWDDYTITFALVSGPPSKSSLPYPFTHVHLQIIAIIEWSLFLAAVQHGAGRHNYYISKPEQIPAQHLLFASTVPWSVSMMFIKISIACMLLRIKQTRPWIIFLWTMIAIQIASCIASLVFQLVQCIPLAAIWDPERYPNAVCAKRESAFISIYVNSAIAITTDLIFAVVPISFITKMQRPLREKIILSCLMGLGVFAATASIVKTTLVKNYGVTGDSLWDAIDLTLWSILEEQTGIIAACIPCLKSPFERILHRIGVLSSAKPSSHHRSHYLTQHGESHQLSSMRPGRKSHGTRIDITSKANAKPSDAQSETSIWPDEEEHDKNYGQRGIVKTMEVQVSSEDDIRGLDHLDEDTGSREWKEGEVSRGTGGWNAV